MGKTTRHFCDHCGCTVSNPLDIQVFMYGKPVTCAPASIPNYGLQYQQAQNQQYGGIPSYSMGGGGGSYTISYPQTSMSNMTSIDLCMRCADIWPKRVAALCKASDPDVAAD